MFSTSPQLQDVPLAALYDEQNEQYLIEQFSTSVTPSFQTIKTDDYVSLQNADVLTMGSTEFQAGSPLPGAGGELMMIAELEQELKPGQNQLVYLNE